MFHESAKASHITFTGSEKHSQRKRLPKPRCFAHNLLQLDPSARICSPKTTSGKAARAFEPAAQTQVWSNQDPGSDSGVESLKSTSLFTMSCWLALTAGFAQALPELPAGGRSIVLIRQHGCCKLQVESASLLEVASALESREEDTVRMIRAFHDQVRIP